MSSSSTNPLSSLTSWTFTLSQTYCESPSPLNIVRFKSHKVQGFVEEKRKLEQEMGTGAKEAKSATTNAGGDGDGHRAGTTMLGPGGSRAQNIVLESARVRGLHARKPMGQLTPKQLKEFQERERKAAILRRLGKFALESKKKRTLQLQEEKENWFDRWIGELILVIDLLWARDWGRLVRVYRDC